MKKSEIKNGKIMLPDKISFATLHGLLRMGYLMRLTVEKDGAKSDELVFGK